MVILPFLIIVLCLIAYYHVEKYRIVHPPEEKLLKQIRAGKV